MGPKGGMTVLPENLYTLRKRQKLTQEQVAAAVGVSRQALSKWETGESVPDIGNCVALARFYDVSLDDLVCYCAEKVGLPIPPRGKHCFGTVAVGPKGEIRLPEKAMELLQVHPGDALLLLGEEGNGLALVRQEAFLGMIQNPR